MCSVSEVWIWSLDRDEFRNLRKTSLSEDTYVVKFSRRSERFFKEILAKFLQNALSRSVEESFERVLDPDPQAEKFPNLTSFSPGRCLPVCLVKIAIEL